MQVNTGNGIIPTFFYAMIVQVFMVILVGCGGIVDGPSPKISSTSPSNGTTGVATNSVITVTFSEKMRPETISTTTFTINGITGTVFHSGMTATFIPSSPLSPSTNYTATITTGVTDLAANPLVADFVWTFTTGVLSDVTPPKVSFTSPVAGATGVARDTAIIATFTEPIDSSTMDSAAFTIDGIAGTVSLVGNTAILKPDVDLDPNIPYTATITTGAKDLAGNQLGGNHTWTFTTGQFIDTESPIVISTNPSSGDTNVAPNRSITVTFNEPIDPSAMTTTNFTLSDGVTPIVGTVISSEETATFAPSGDLIPITTYTVTITTGVRDLSGNPIIPSHTWSFTTGSLNDTTVPSVSATNPADVASDVAIHSVITATFSEAMDPETINTSTFIINNGVTGTLTIAGKTATYTPTLPLAPNTLYTATITTCAKDLAGISLPTSHVWTFTTEDVPDTVSPVVTTTGPADGATEVSVDTVVTATFSERVNPSTIDATTFNVAPEGGGDILGEVIVVDTTATFTPASPLSNGITYDIKIRTDIEDLAGNPLNGEAKPFRWKFNTKP